MKKLFSIFAALLFAGSMIADEASVSIETYATNNSWADATQYTSVTLDENVTATVSGGGNTGKYYTNGNDWRLYQSEDASITIATTSGTLNSITITYGTKNSGELKDGSSAVKSGTAVSVSGDSKTFTVGNSGSATNGQVKITAISVTYTPSASGVAKPTFTPTKGDFVGSVNVTLACTTPEAVVYYTTDESFSTSPSTVDWIPYSTAIPLSATTTIWAASLKGDEWSDVVEKTYTKHETIDCAAAAALAQNAIAYLGEVTVTYVNGANIYVKDASGSALLYAFDYGLVPGDVVNGFVGVSSPYNGLPELKPSGITKDDLTVVHGTAPDPEELTAAPTAADINKYVILKNVSVEGEFTSSAKANLTATIGEQTFTLRNNFQIAQTFVAGKKYDIVGAGAIYNTNLQLYFISATESTATAIDNAEAEVKAIKRFENGVLIIEKNGVKYNAQGAVVR